MTGEINERKGRRLFGWVKTPSREWRVVISELPVADRIRTRWRDLLRVKNARWLEKFISKMIVINFAGSRL